MKLGSIWVALSAASPVLFSVRCRLALFTNGELNGALRAMKKLSRDYLLARVCHSTSSGGEGQSVFSKALRFYGAEADQRRLRDWSPKRMSLHRHGGQSSTHGYRGQLLGEAPRTHPSSQHSISAKYQPTRRGPI